MEYFLFGFAEAHRIVKQLETMEIKMNKEIDREIELKQQSADMH